MTTETGKSLFFSLTVFMAFALIFSTIALCQNWTPLPPYNTLWPLWSPALSPVNPATGLNTPIIASLTPDTVLPVQPGLTWDPGRDYPWLLYNTPLGMIYYDALFGLNPWPPLGLIPPITGTPFTITLPSNFGSLPPTDPTQLLNNVPLANELYASIYPLFASAAALPLTFGFTPPPVPSITFTAALPIPVPGAATVVVPPVLSATAILGLQ